MAEKPEPTIVILRRALVPNYRKPKRTLPGDYFAVVINSKANRGALPALTSYFDADMAPCWGEVPLAYYQRSAPASPEECPPGLIRSLGEVEPVGPVVYRKRLSRAALEHIWSF